MYLCKTKLWLKCKFIMVRDGYKKAKGISSLFSRRVFSDILHHNDFTLINQILDYYDMPEALKAEPLSKTFKKAYSFLAKDYRCEYLYKNELINQKLLKEYGHDETIAFNEFKVGNSIADMAMFNGESKAFEIKSDLDSPFRLSGQICDYSQLFQKCYIVVPESEVEKYIKTTGEAIGVILLKREKRHIELQELRKAEPNHYIDYRLVMRCLHTKEYMHLIETYFDKLPQVSMFEMFNECSKMMEAIPYNDLQKLFLNEIETRRNATERLTKVQKELRQVCLSLNLNNKEIAVLNQQLSQPLN